MQTNASKFDLKQAKANKCKQMQAKASKSKQMQAKASNNKHMETKASNGKQTQANLSTSKQNQTSVSKCKQRRAKLGGLGMGERGDCGVPGGAAGTFMFCYQNDMFLIGFRLPLGVPRRQVQNLLLKPPSY